MCGNQLASRVMELILPSAQPKVLSLNVTCNLSNPAPEVQESHSWVLIETVHNGGARSDRQRQEEWARINSPLVLVKSNISLTTMVSRTALAHATVHLLSKDLIC